MVHCGQQRPHRSPGSATLRGEAHGRIRSRYRQQPRSDAVPPRLRHRCYPRRSKRRSKSLKSGAGFLIVKFTYYGHSCFSVLAGGKTLLFDPFVTANHLARAINVDQIQADFIFVSHGHFDHTSDAARIAKRTGAKVLGNWEIFDWFKKGGLENVHPINPGGQFTFDFGTVKSFIAQHSSSLPDGSYGGVACGFAFTTSDGNFYYSGDSGLTLDMQLVSDWTALDFAVFPVGDGLTMGVGDAIKASRLAGVNKVVGVHYDTFDFIKLDHPKAIESFKKAGMTLHLM